MSGRNPPLWLTIRIFILTAGITAKTLELSKNTSIPQLNAREQHTRPKIGQGGSESPARYRARQPGPKNSWGQQRSCRTHRCLAKVQAPKRIKTAERHEGPGHLISLRERNADPPGIRKIHAGSLLLTAISTPNHSQSGALDEAQMARDEWLWVPKASKNVAPETRGSWTLRALWWRTHGN
ncbi:hypothetical protein BOTBODRAFT_40936 [Botryobasidium botryosum FD-172 SS1]|uniref:Uncharacterized protein n=1 Tax=Botryobasidium botryosum (strain FD-172 SS1) TaxID=930990 RepID=A0A067N1U1_BOTB1|nr:hypothetical protein BOTBODRAFT_40936 [Botryobasidium botryosum FD-172 SS1]